LNATVILPVKRFARAKTRLVEAIGPQGRASLLRAMLTDALAAIARTERVERVVVVTGEGRAERIALETAKHVKTPIEVLQDPHDPGHSEAATIGIVRAKALGASCVALLPGDCPLLDPAELDGALDRVEDGTVGVIPDRHGTGTNGLLLAPGDAIGPAFGPDSCERHLDRAARAGWRAVRVELPSLALDLDTADDLAELRTALAVEPDAAPATAAALGDLP
jgi:2-phospho-L-lactate/phosphoenolpyruvate guanylyltransferase